MKLVREGVSVSHAHALDKEPFHDNPRPLGRQMTLDAGGHAMDLEAVAHTAARLRRSEFLVTAAPVPGGTGFPLNPIVTF